MRKRIRRQGKLIQNKRKKEVSTNDASQRQAKEGFFRVIATTADLRKAWVEGEYSTFREAKSVVDNSEIIGVNYYVHSDSSRVLYSKKGDVNA